MKKSSSIIVLMAMAWVVSGLSVLSGASDGLTGEDIARKINGANKPAAGLVIKGEMELKSLNSGNTEKRKYISMSLNQNGSDNFLFRFTDSSYRNTTFLTIGRPEGRNLQYIYLKSVGSARQVESSDKENSFVDTDIANEDMGGSTLSDYTYNRLEDVTVDGKDCYVIDRMPRKKGSKYTKFHVVVDKGTLIPVAVKAYDKNGRVVKTVRSSDIRKISDGLYMAFETVVTSVEKRHQTVVRIFQAVEKQVQAGLFKPERISSIWQEQGEK